MKYQLMKEFRIWKFKSRVALSMLYPGQFLFPFVFWIVLLISSVYSGTWYLKALCGMSIFYFLHVIHSNMWWFRGTIHPLSYRTHATLPSGTSFLTIAYEPLEETVFIVQFINKETGNRLHLIQKDYQFCFEQIYNKKTNVLRPRSSRSLFSIDHKIEIQITDDEIIFNGMKAFKNIYKDVIVMEEFSRDINKLNFILDFRSPQKDYTINPIW